MKNANLDRSLKADISMIPEAEDFIMEILSCEKVINREQILEEVINREIRWNTETIDRALSNLLDGERIKWCRGVYIFNDYAYQLACVE